MIEAFSIGSEVCIGVGTDLFGVVTAICIRAGDHTTYEVSWIHNHDHNSKWFESFEVHPRQESDTRRVGFVETGCGLRSAMRSVLESLECNDGNTARLIAANALK